MIHYKELTYTFICMHLSDTTITSISENLYANLDLAKDV